jgi:hypothetical protein
MLAPALAAGVRAGSPKVSAQLLPPVESVVRHQWTEADVADDLVDELVSLCVE